MAISLDCACGKRTQVRDELAGKKVRCPACSTVLSVPDGEMEVEEAPRAAAIRAKVPPPLAARDSQPAVKARRRRDDDDEEDGEREVRRRPRRKAASSNKTAWIIGGVSAGVVLIAALVTVLIVMSKKDKDSTDTADSGNTPDKNKPADNTKPPDRGPEDRGPGPRGVSFFGAAQSAASRNNLKQLALAAFIYHDAMNVLPGPILGPNGQPLLSWRVQLLPYIEQNNLYVAIHRDEPWDSPYNRQFWTKMPKTFALPGRDGEGGGVQTYYQAFKGMGTPIWTPNTRMTSLTKGTSNTILFAEASRGVNWMAPDDITFPPGPSGLSPRQIGGHYGEYANVAMADGSVRRISWNMAPRTLQAAVSLAGDAPNLTDPGWQN